MSTSTGIEPSKFGFQIICSKKHAIKGQHLKIAIKFKGSTNFVYILLGFDIGKLQ